jgi:hypothetical protein
MVGRARMRDRVYFAADSTAARDLGVCRRTIIRWRKALEAQGRIERCGVHRWGPRKTTVVYRFCGQRVTQRTSCRRTKPPRAGVLRTNHFVGSSGTRARVFGRRRRLMEKHPEVISNGIERANGTTTPFNAGDAVAVVADRYGHPIPGSWRARLGKAAKELLEDGFDPNTVCAAMYASIRRARPDLTISLAMEIQNARTGQTMTMTEWRNALYAVREESAPEVSKVYLTLKEAIREGSRG